MRGLFTIDRRPGREGGNQYHYDEYYCRCNDVRQINVSGVLNTIIGM